jgi:hypothetical protein
VAWRHTFPNIADWQTDPSTLLHVYANPLDATDRTTVYTVPRLLRTSKVYGPIRRTWQRSRFKVRSMASGIGKEISFMVSESRDVEIEIRVVFDLDIVIRFA